MQLLNLINKSESENFTITKAYNDLKNITFQDDKVEISSYIQKKNF